ncbi:MAG: hypothetical protein P8Z30_00175 [Acidobacteriota bacterium]|jgi:hypothetical protein
MRMKTLIGTVLLVVFSIFAIGSFAQRSSAQTDTSNRNATSATAGTMGQRGMMNGGSMSGGMMNGSMMNGRMMNGRMMDGRTMMGRNMMGNYGTMRKLMNRLTSDLSAAEAQAGSAALKSKLDDAGALVSKLRGELSSSWGMMARYMPMHGSYYCSWNQTGQKQTGQNQK